MRLGFGRTRLAAPAGGVALIAPRDRFRFGEVLGGNGFQPVAALAVDRHKVGDRMLGDGAVPEHQRPDRGNGHAECVQFIGVGRDLQQRGDLRMARQLGVPHCPPVLTVHVDLANQEVGVAKEAQAVERALVDDVCTRDQRLRGALGDSTHRVGAALRPRQLEYTGSVRGVVLAVLGNQLIQHT